MIERVETARAASPPCGAWRGIAKSSRKNPQEEFLRMLPRAPLDSTSISDDQVMFHKHGGESRAIDVDEARSWFDRYWRGGRKKQAIVPAGAEAPKPVDPTGQIDGCMERSRVCQL